MSYTFMFCRYETKTQETKTCLLLSITAKTKTCLLLSITAKTKKVFIVVNYSQNQKSVLLKWKLRMHIIFACTFESKIII
jgi:hypothetical protein